MKRGPAATQPRDLVTSCELPKHTEAAPIKCDGRESVGRPTDSHIESAGRLTNSATESVGKPEDSLPAHFIGAASGNIEKIDLRFIQCHVI